MTVGIKKSGYLLNKECACIASGDIEEVTRPVHSFLVGFVDSPGEGVLVQIAPTKIGRAELFRLWEIRAGGSTGSTVSHDPTLKGVRSASLRLTAVLSAGCISAGLPGLD